MTQRCSVVLVAALFVAAVGCQPARRSGAGFRLPPGGDAERGRAAFLSFGCNICHEVAGVDLPLPEVRRATTIVLGGPVQVEPTDGRLVTAIIYPSNKPAWHMPDYSDRMTVQQVADIVAFLQPQYVLLPRLRPYPYHLRIPEH